MYEVVRFEIHVGGGARGKLQEQVVTEEARGGASDALFVYDATAVGLPRLLNASWS